MTADDNGRGGFTLKRWSQRKLAAARAAAASGTATPAVPASTPAVAAGTVPEVTSRPAVEPAALPPIDSLTIESDFTAFLQPKVAEGLKREALKQLFRDPHFNAMDGLDVYIDDYSRADPIAPEIARKLAQARYILNPPPTRVNDRGVVEDVPPDELAKALPAPAEERPTEDASTETLAADDASGVVPVAPPDPDVSRS